MPEEKQDRVFQSLQKVRQDVGYDGEMHYGDLRGHSMVPKARCATGWLNLYAGQFSDFCFCYCLAIDTHSSGFQHERFGEPHHAYNRFARMAVEGGIAWSLKRYERVDLRFYSDEKCRQEVDNFALYVSREICASICEKRKKKRGDYPEIRLAHPEVIPVTSDPSRAAPNIRQECELIQLADLLTSSIAQALTGRSGQKAKITLAEMVARWIEDTRKPPWLQTAELHRRFSVSCFPDEKGRFYNPAPAVMNRNQLALFELEEE